MTVFLPQQWGGEPVEEAGTCSSAGWSSGGRTTLARWTLTTRCATYPGMERRCHRSTMRYWWPRCCPRHYQPLQQQAAAESSSPPVLSASSSTQPVTLLSRNLSLRLSKLQVRIIFLKIIIFFLLMSWMVDKIVILSIFCFHISNISQTWWPHQRLLSHGRWKWGKNFMKEKINCFIMRLLLPHDKQKDLGWLWVLCIWVCWKMIFFVSFPF